MKTRLNYISLFVLFVGANILCAQGTSICYGDSTLLILDNYHGVIQWEKSNDQVTWNAILGETNDSLMVRNQTIATYYRSVVTDGTCAPSYSDTTLVTVYPQLNAYAGNDTIVCLGSGTTLGATVVASGGSGSYAYTWLPGAGLSATNVANPIAIPTQTTSYTLIVVDTHGCSISDVVTVQVNGACALDSLVINEIDYDQVGNDTLEFVELYNKSNTSIDLQNLVLVFVNGADSSEYSRVSLSTAGILAPGAYVVVKSAYITTPGGVATVLFSSNKNKIQNGAPDGVIVLDLLTNTFGDRLSYEGAIRAASIVGYNAGLVSLVEGTVLNSSVSDSNTNIGSLVRLPNGSDTNNANVDWNFSSTPTPGAPNN